MDKNADAAGVPLARRLGLKVVIGETHREETLLAAGVDWSPRSDDELRPQDRLVVLATRAGLSRVLARSRPG